MVFHGLSVAAISVGDHLSRLDGERAPLFIGEIEGLETIDHSDLDSASSISGGEDGDNDLISDLMHV